MFRLTIALQNEPKEELNKLTYITNQKIFLIYKKFRIINYELDKTMEA